MAAWRRGERRCRTFAASQAYAEFPRKSCERKQERAAVEGGSGIPNRGSERRPAVASG